MKGQAQQSLFISTTSDTIGDIEEGLGQKLTVLNDANAASFFDHEQTAGAIRLQVHGTVQAGDNRLPVIGAGVGKGCGRGLVGASVGEDVDGRP